jgi:transcriptional regulator with PAS, ATPase and Fis domain
MVAENKFRQDLLYRINTVEIDIPPLRERKEDIALLAEHFLAVYKEKYNKHSLRLSPVTIKKLENYKWPGNVRELQHAIERSTILSDSDILQPSDFFFTSPETKEEKFIFDTYNLEEVEKAVIRKVLDANGGNVSKAARELGLTRAALYRRMEKYAL